MTNERVVVLGGSMAGLLAAAVAARHSREVLIVERDRLDGDHGDAPTARKGVPQARHSHNLYPSGRAIIEALVPGFTDELRARGAEVHDSGDAGRWIIGGARLARVRTDRLAVFASRPVIDAALLARVRALPNVRIVDRTDVAGLLFEGDVVVGARALPRDDEGAAHDIRASWVIDAMGRGSRATAWLQTRGFASPELETYEVKVAYATRTFVRKEGELGGDHYVFVSGLAPDLPRGGVALAVEGQRWMVLLFGSGGTKPPTDLEGFRRYAAELAVPDIGALVASAEPLDDGVPFAFPRSQRRRFDRMKMPTGLLVMGDALVSTSPNWGAGMTTAAQQARALSESFEADALMQFHRRAIAATHELWEATTQNDLGFDAIEGRQALPFRIIHRYVGALARAAETDPVLAKAFLGVIDRVKSPPSVLAPSLLWRVLTASLRAGKALPARAIVI